MPVVSSDNIEAGPALYRRIGYGVALFLSSAGALVIEIVAGRMLAPYVGMSLYTWTAIIAVVLAGLSVGHWIGGVLSSGSRARSYNVLAAAMLLAGATAAASLLLIRLLSPLILYTGFHPIAAIVLLTSCLFFLPSLFVGLVSPVLTKLAVDDAPMHHRGHAIGQMYALGAVGSIVGTLAAGYVFISWIGSIGTILAVAVTYLILGSTFAVASRASARAAGALAVAAVILIAGGGLLGQRLAAFETPCTDESNYYCIRVVDYTFETGRPSALMVIDHLGHGINDRDDPTRLHSSYLELIDRFVRPVGAGASFSALFLGGGAYTLPRAWSAAYPQAELAVVEIDPAVTRVAKDQMWFKQTPNLKIRHQDGRLLLQSLPAQPRFDVIVGDAFHDISAPAHLVSQEFAVAVRKRLKSGGIYTLNVLDSARRPMFLFAVIRTLRQVFPSVEAWADMEQLASGGRLTFIVRAASEPTPHGRIVSEIESEEGFRRTWLRWPAERLQEEIDASEVPVLTDDYAPVDRLMFPVLKEDL